MDWIPVAGFPPRDCKVVWSMKQGSLIYMAPSGLVPLLRTNCILRRSVTWAFTRLPAPKKLSIALGL